MPKNPRPFAAVQPLLPRQLNDCVILPSLSNSRVCEHGNADMRHSAWPGSFPGGKANYTRRHDAVGREIGTDI